MRSKTLKSNLVPVHSGNVNIRLLATTAAAAAAAAASHPRLGGDDCITGSFIDTLVKSNATRSMKTLETIPVGYIVLASISYAPRGSRTGVSYKET